jgi:hypothetical protein
LDTNKASNSFGGFTFIQNNGAGFLQKQQKLFRSSLLKKSGSINFNDIQS